MTEYLKPEDVTDEMRERFYDDAYSPSGIGVAWLGNAIKAGWHIAPPEPEWTVERRNAAHEDQPTWCLVQSGDPAQPRVAWFWGKEDAQRVADLLNGGDA